jgi:hypothetical protein
MAFVTKRDEKAKLVCFTKSSVVAVVKDFVRMPGVDRAMDLTHILFPKKSSSLLHVFKAIRLAVIDVPARCTSLCDANMSRFR